MYTAQEPWLSGLSDSDWEPSNSSKQHPAHECDEAQVSQECTAPGGLLIPAAL